ncbi:MAG: glycosyltransferase family 4 protein [Candidatus Omnitrophica bacterium]|nr:glycosyltransferase family 4 protein [Candidatus Omnitrophota bacterium]
MSEMKRLRVLHIITRLDPGGSTTNTLETVSRLDGDSYEVDLVAGRTTDPTGRAAEFIRERGIRCTFVAELVRDVHPWLDILALLRLRRIIRRGRYDIVHTHSSKAGILGRWAAKWAGVRTIVHTPHGHIFYGYFSALPTRVFILVERWTALITTRLIALTDRGIAEHLAHGVGRPAQWSAVPSGIDLDGLVREIPASADCRRRIGAGAEEVVLVTVTRLEPIKGNHVLLEALAALEGKVHSTRLFVVGEGRARQVLEEQAARLGVAGRVVFVGFQDRVADYLVAADIFVLPSLNEGMGRAVLEAMACGRPVVASRVGGIPDLVEDGVQGFLVPPGDAVALARALGRLASEPELRSTMGQNAWSRATQKFSVEAMVNNISEIYLEAGRKR